MNKNLLHKWLCTTKCWFGNPRGLTLMPSKEQYIRNIIKEKTNKTGHYNSGTPYLPLRQTSFKSSINMNTHVNDPP